MERLPALAAELVAQKPAVIVSAAVPVHHAVKQATSTIPIVMATGADPVEAGLVKSLANPGGNLTGISGFFEATPLKMLELAASLLPKGGRVALVVEANTPFTRAQYTSDIERAAQSLRLRPEFVRIATASDMTRAVRAMEQKRPDAVIVLPGPTIFAAGRDMVSDIDALKVPVIYPFEEFAEAGGLMSYAAPLAESYRRAAYYVDRILKGAKPAELPIELPTRLSLTVNLQRARTLGIKLPASVMQRADRLIE